MAAQSALPYSDIYEQYVTDASFLWVLRKVALDQPNYNAADIAEIEHRISAQVNGLKTSPEISWPLLQEAATIGEPGELFALSLFAFESRDVEKIKYATEMAMASPRGIEAVASALAWLTDKNQTSEWLTKFYHSKTLLHKLIALHTSLLIEEDPAEKLTMLLAREDCQNHQQMLTTALYAVGMFKRKDLTDVLRAHVTSENSSVKLAAISSGILLGYRNLVNSLSTFVFDETSTQELRNRAINVLFRVLDVSAGREIIKQMITRKIELRATIKAVQMLGDPASVRWLITLMYQPKHARIAAEAFSTITGIDLVEKNLELSVPEITELEIADENEIPLIEDENLPWPDADKISATWHRYSSKFHEGKRYFNGIILNSESLASLKRQATKEFAFAEYSKALSQRARNFVAWEVALQNPTEPLINCHAKVLVE